jgi:predicted kinase
MTPGDVVRLLALYRRCLAELADAVVPEPAEPVQLNWGGSGSLAFRLPGGSTLPEITIGIAVSGGRLYDDADACDLRETAVGIDDPEQPDAVDGLDDIKPESKSDFKARLDGLPHGHPSSPYNEDGSLKPPVTSLRDLELPESGTQDRPSSDRPRPLTDLEHTEHVSEIRLRLDRAQSDGLATNEQYTIDGDGEAWEKERRAGHDSIIEDLYKKSADVPNDHRAILAGGLAGAGKSTILDRYADVDRSQYLTINPDIIKEELADRGLVPEVEGLSPMEASDLVHEETSHISKQLALRALAEGRNVIWDITMSSQETTEERINNLRSADYKNIKGIFVDIPLEVSVARADARHRRGHDDYLSGKGLGGRFVPEDVILKQADPVWGSVNRRTFEAIKSRLDRWSMYDNSVDGGVPVLVGAERREERTP